MNQAKIPVPMEAQKIFLLLKMDAKNLFERLSERRDEYLSLFSLKRTREHFKEIFFSRYRGLSAKDLTYCGAETLVALDKFYSIVEKLDWYFRVTEALPQTVLDHTARELKKIEEHYQTLDLYLNAELGIAQEENLQPLTES